MKTAPGKAQNRPLLPPHSNRQRNATAKSDSRRG
jgi:hypothetical protein